MNIFITGATSGFGLATTDLFCSKGHQVIATGRRKERLYELKEKYKNQIHIIELDIRDYNKVKNAIANLPDNFKSIDVLINNAGLALGMDSAQKGNIEDWNVMVDTNITGLLNCTNVILPLMTANNHGHIVNLGSIAGEFPYPGGNVYGATKSFVHQFSLNLKADLLGTKIRVTNIEPGMCETEFSEVRFLRDKEKAKNVYKGMTPLSARDIAETIDWIISRPAHVNINTISLMPVDQAFGAFATNRKS